MFHDNDQYTLHKEIVGGFTHYYIGYTDEQGIFQESQVTRNVFAAYLRFGKNERNLRRWDERHKEKSDLIETTLHKRAFCLPQSMENQVIDAERNERLWQTIAELPEIQQRRFILYHKYGLTYEQIAEQEGCTKRAVKFSVDLAKEKILRKLKKL